MNWASRRGIAAVVVVAVALVSAGFQFIARLDGFKEEKHYEAEHSKFA